MTNYGLINLGTKAIIGSAAVLIFGWSLSGFSNETSYWNRRQSMRVHQEEVHFDVKSYGTEQRLRVKGQGYSFEMYDDFPSDGVVDRVKVRRGGRTVMYDRTGLDEQVVSSSQDEYDFYLAQMVGARLNHGRDVVDYIRLRRERLMGTVEGLADSLQVQQ